MLFLWSRWTSKTGKWAKQYVAACYYMLFMLKKLEKTQKIRSAAEENVTKIYDNLHDKQTQLKGSLT